MGARDLLHPELTDAAEHGGTHRVARRAEHFGTRRRARGCCALRRRAVKCGSAASMMIGALSPASSADDMIRPSCRLAMPRLPANRS